MNETPFIESVSCFVQLYEDTALFGIFAKSREMNQLPTVALFTCEELLILLQTKIDFEFEDEVKRAKNQLRSQLLTLLESRQILVEEMGRQILIHNHLISGEEYCQMIRDIQPIDLINLAKKIILGPKPPTIASFGLKHVNEKLPLSDSLVSAFQNWENIKPKHLRTFLKDQQGNSFLKRKVLSRIFSSS